MIQPGMSATGKRPAALPLHATMLCFITTDAAIEAKALQGVLREAVAQSFNRITVDGDMGTNDTVLVLGNGLAGNRNIQPRTSSIEHRTFQAALNHVCLELVKMIVRDGEGVHRVVTVRVVDLHVSSIGPSLYAATVSVEARDAEQAHRCRARLSDGLGLAHVTVEASYRSSC